MEWYTTLLIGIAILFALFLSGAPIFLAFLFAILVWGLCHHRPGWLPDVCQFGSRYRIDNVTGVDPAFHLDGRVTVSIRHNGRIVRFNRQTGRTHQGAPIRTGRGAVGGVWSAERGCDGRCRHAWDVPSCRACRNGVITVISLLA